MSPHFVGLLAEGQRLALPLQSRFSGRALTVTANIRSLEQLPRRVQRMISMELFITGAYGGTIPGIMWRAFWRKSLRNTD